MEHRTLAELDSGLDYVRASPADSGRIEVVVRRPSVGQREVLIEAELSLTKGVMGDSLAERGSSRTLDSPEGRELRLRGANARVVQPGRVRVGDAVRKLPATHNTSSHAEIA